MAEWTPGDLERWPGCDFRIDYGTSGVILVSVSRLREKRWQRHPDRPFSIRWNMNELHPRITDFATEDLAKAAAERAVARWMKAAGMRWANG